MKGKESGEAKGYAFVTFKSKELASKAIDKLNNSEFKVIWYTYLLSFSVNPGVFHCSLIISSWSPLSLNLICLFFYFLF